MTGTQKWYDELARVLSDLGAKVVVMKKMAGDLSYVTVPYGPDEHIEICEKNQELVISKVADVPGVFDDVTFDIATVYRWETAGGIVRRTLEKASVS